MTKKLYRIELMKLRDKVWYVVADNPTIAYVELREYLDDKDYGFRQDRELSTITLLADGDFFANAGFLLGSDIQ